MKIAKVSTIVNDDGSSLSPATELQVKDLFNRFKTRNVLGRWSPVSDAAALRMVVTVLDAYQIYKKSKVLIIEELVICLHLK